MSSARVREDTQPWYKEILMSGPAIVVVACVITIYLAFSNYDRPLSGAVKKGLQILPTNQTEQVEHKE